MRRTIQIWVAIALLAVCVTGNAAVDVYTTYYHTDLVGSPVAATNEAGALIWRESYNPYGTRRIIDSRAREHTRRFTDKTEDSTGLLYFGARYYDPEIGRFMATDPVGFVEDNPTSFNRYAYANNSPYGYVDPDGQLPFLLLIPLIIKAVDLGITAYDTHQAYQEGGVKAAAKELGTNAIASAVPGMKSGRTLLKALGKSGSDVTSEAATDVSERLYHYGFSRNADSILKEGLQPGIGSGKAFTTPSGGLSPLQAQIDLALPPNRGLSDALFEIDASALRRMGIEIPTAQPVGRAFNMPGGGSEVIFQHPIPADVIRRIR